jgi:hypothetical protein
MRECFAALSRSEKYRELLWTRVNRHDLDFMYAKLNGGDVAQVSGLDLSALAAMITPMVMTEPQPQRTPDSKQDEKFNL